MSLDGFRRRCEQMIQEGDPFVTYWHAHGFGFFHTAAIQLDHHVLQVEHPDGKVRTVTVTPRAYPAFIQTRGNLLILSDRVDRRTKKVTASTRKAIDKTIDQMRRQTPGLYVVHYDGSHVAVDGPESALEELEALGGPR